MMKLRLMRDARVCAHYRVSFGISDSFPTSGDLIAMLKRTDYAVRGP